MNEKPECKIDEKQAIMNSSRTMCIVKMEAVKLKGYKTMGWDNFKDLRELQELDGKPEFAMEHLKDAKYILRGMGLDLQSCIYYYCREQPLIIDTGEGWAIGIAPILQEE